MAENQVLKGDPTLRPEAGKNAVDQGENDLKHPAAHHPPPQSSARASWTRDLLPLQGERLALSSDGVTGVVLRYGQLYGPGTYFSGGGDFARQARQRMLPIVGRGDGVFSFLHVDDAASAAVCALKSGKSIYNIVDGEPVQCREWIPAYLR